jgi:hypothetical protein
MRFRRQTVAGLDEDVEVHEVAGLWQPVGTLAERALRRIGPKSLPWGALWHATLWLSTEYGRPAAEIWGRRESRPWSVVWEPPSEGRYDTQTFFLPAERALPHAVWLSLIYGLDSGHLWKCRRCGRAFLREGRSDKTCSRCLRGRRLPPRLWKILRALSVRLSLWTSARGYIAQDGSRRRLSKDLAAKRRRDAESDMHLVAIRKMTLTRWRHLHDERHGKGGRPAISGRRTVAPTRETAHRERDEPSVAELMLKIEEGMSHRTIRATKLG